MAEGTPASSLRKGVLFLVTSAFGFALMGMFVHLADFHGGHISAIQKSFFRNLVALALAAVLFARGRKRRAAAETRLHKGAKVWALLMARAVFGTVGVFGNFYALSNMPVADALMLNKLAPFFTVLFSWLFIRERISFRQALCLAMAFAGATFVVKPGFGTAALAPALCGVAGGVGAGAAYTCLRELGIMKVDGAFIVLFFSAFSTLASVPFMLVEFHPMTAAQVMILMGAGAAAALGQFAVTAAYRFAEARRIAVWDYTNIIFGAILGFLAFGQVPDVWSVLGFALIVSAAAAGNLWYNRRNERQNAG